MNQSDQNKIAHEVARQLADDISQMANNGETKMWLVRFLKGWSAELTLVATLRILERGADSNEWKPKLNQALRVLAREIRWKKLRYGEAAKRLPCCSEVPIWPLCDRGC